MPRVHHLRLDPNPPAVLVGDDLKLVDVEAQLVQAFDVLVHPPLFVREERGLSGERVPQGRVLRDQPVPDVDGVVILGKVARRLQIHELADDVRACHVDVIQPLALGDPVVDLARLGVDEVCGEFPGVAPEQRIGKGNVAPEESEEVKPHEQNRKGPDEPVDRLGALILAEQSAVGKRVRQMLRNEDRVERVARTGRPPGDDGYRFDAGRVQPLKRAQHLVLVMGRGIADLLDGQNAPVQVDESHDVAGNALRKRSHNAVWPSAQRLVPRKVEKGRIGLGRGDPQRGAHRPRLLGGLRASRRL